MTGCRRLLDADRAQSEVVGTVLVTLLVITATVSIGTVLVFNLNQQIQAIEEPSEFAVDLQPSTLTVTHLGGRDFALSDLDLLVRQGEAENRSDLEAVADPENDSIDADEWFEGGESVTVENVSATGEIRILLVDTSAGGVVLYDERRAVPSTPAATPGTPTPTTPTATPTPTPDPAVSGYRLQDTSSNSNAEYTLFYGVENVDRFDHIEITFDNQGSDWGDSPVTSTDARGNVTFSQGGGQGSQYEITIRVFDVDGAVTDTVTITDAADGDSQSGGDVARPDSPAFAGTVVDDLGGDEASYEVSYNVTNRANFGSVRVRYENLDNGWADATYASADPRDNVDAQTEANFGGTAGDEYRVTVQLLDSTGVVVDERVVADVADGIDPSGNADLSRETSPTLSETTVRDRSEYSTGEYRIQYRVSDPDSEFARAEALVRNVESSWASADLSSESANGTLEYSRGGTEGDSYRITVRVLDADGIVVDERVITDVADGTDPSETG